MAANLFSRPNSESGHGLWQAVLTEGVHFGERAFRLFHFDEMGPPIV